MERSRVPLSAWFRAIETLLYDPTATTADLVAATNIQRAATVRRIAKQIRRVIGSQQQSEQLAGLDQLFGI